MNKKIRILIFPMILALCLALIPMESFGASSAKSIPSCFYINNQFYSSEAFTYAGVTYYKLADVAYGLKETPKKVKVNSSGNSLTTKKGTAQPLTKGIFCGSKGKVISSSS